MADIKALVDLNFYSERDYRKKHSLPCWIFGIPLQKYFKFKFFHQHWKDVISKGLLYTPTEDFLKKVLKNGNYSCETGVLKPLENITSSTVPDLDKSVIQLFIRIRVVFRIKYLNLKLREKRREPTHKKKVKKWLKSQA